MSRPAAPSFTPGFTLVALVALGIGLVGPAAAQSRLRFQQAHGAYTFEIRQTDAECDGAPADRLFSPDHVFAASGFAVPGSTPECPPDQTFTLRHRGQAMDSLGAFRVWLGAEMDTLLLWGNRDPADLPLPAGAVRDLTGDGTAELIVATWSGGAHCCHSYAVVSLGETPRLLGVIDTQDGELRVEASTGGLPTLTHHDFAFAYWNESFAGSPAPRVVLTWDGERFAPDPDRMTEPPLPAAELARLVAETRADAAWASAFPPSAYWGTLLDLLYAGRGAQAAAFARDAWPGDALGQAVFLRWFADQLGQSPYGTDVADFNRDAVDWL